MHVLKEHSVEVVRAELDLGMRHDARLSAMDVGDVTVGSRQLAGLAVHGVVEVGESRGFVVLNVEPADDSTQRHVEPSADAEVGATDASDVVSNSQGLNGR